MPQCDITSFGIVLFVEQAIKSVLLYCGLRKAKGKERLLETTAKLIEEQIKQYAKDFLKTEYGDQAVKKLEQFEITAVDAFDVGGVSEVVDTEIKIAVKRDVDAHKLTNTTKLIVRHEIGHILDEKSPDFPEFEEQIEHEKIAWIKAKPKTPAEHWYKNVSIRTHIDPLKMQSMGFPRPERKVSQELLKIGTNMEVKRMRKDSLFVDKFFAQRLAMANLVDDINYYNQ